MRCYICDYSDVGLSDQEVDGREFRLVKTSKDRVDYICSHCDHEVQEAIHEMEEFMEGTDE